MSLNHRFGRTTSLRIAVMALVLPVAVAACSDASGDTPSGSPSPAPIESDVTASPESASAGEGDDGFQDIVDFTDELTEDSENPDIGDLTGLTTFTDGAGELVMAGESFSFTIELCVITDHDIVIHGPGVGNESNDPAYLDITLSRDGNFRNGEARVDLAGTEQMMDLDAYYVLDIDAGHEYQLVTDDQFFELQGDFYYSGKNNLGPGTMTVECR